MSESNSWCIVQTLGISISDKVKYKVKNVAAMVGTTVHDAVLSAMDNLVVPWKELSKKSVDAFSGLNPSSVVLHPDQWDFSGDTGGLQMASLGRFKRNINHKSVDGTGGSVTVICRAVKEPLIRKNVLITPVMGNTLFTNLVSQPRDYGYG